MLCCKGGKRWHKRCFKCSTCSKKLDAVTARCHGDGLYCKACHLKLGPHESPKIHADPSIIKPADGKVEYAIFFSSSDIPIVGYSRIFKLLFEGAMHTGL